MSADNEEFSIPFEESRRGAKSSPEEKAAIGRLGRYLGSRAIDRPSIGERRRGRNRRDVNLPTGGKPGTRTPTGSRRDVDGDGWADEGTTKPVWVGVDGQGRGDGTPGRRQAQRDRKFTPALSSGADYMGQHQAPDRDNGAPLDDLTANGIYPDDIYSNDALEMYGFGGEFSAQALSIANSAKGKPNKQIKIYRAVPLSTEDEIRELEKQAAQILRRGRIPNNVTTPLDVSEYYDFVKSEIERLKNLTPDEKIKINPGDWVTPIREYAVSHGRSHLNNKYKIVSKTVPAKHLFTDGNSIEEWGYDPGVTTKRTDSKEGIFAPRGKEIGDQVESLSSGKTYQEIVDAQPELTGDQRQAISDFLDMLESPEFKKEDIRVLDTGPRPPRPPGMPEPKPVMILQDSEDRKLKKETLRNLFAEVFDGEMTLDNDVIVKSDTGEELNIGKTVLIEAIPISKYLTPVKINRVSDKDIAEQEELELYDKPLEMGDLLTEVELELRIKPLPEYNDRLVEILKSSDDKSRYISKEDGTASIGKAARTLVQASADDKEIRMMSHDSFYVSGLAQGQGLGSFFNARNEKIYEGLGVSSIFTHGVSDNAGSRGAVHWPKNGFSWGGEAEKQKFIKVIDDALTNNQELFSQQDKEKISSLYRKNEDTGLFETDATAEELLDFPAANEVFSNATAQFMYVRPIRELVGALGRRGDSEQSGLSSGKAPRYPRTPTLGAFLGKADEDFANVGSWEEFKRLYDDKEVVFFDYETTGLVFDEFGQEIAKGAPVQFGAVKIKNGKEVGRINLFMNPEEELGEWSRNNLKDVDGNPLTDDWLGQQMSIADAHRQLIEFAGPDALFGVQNAAFDKAVLDGVLENMGEEWRPSGYLDTREIAALTLPKWTPETDDGPFVLDKEGNKKPSSSLAAITKYLGVELGDGHHNADADAFATSQVMQKIIDGAIEKGWSKDALSKEKRDAIHKPSVDKFNSELSQFEKEKSQYQDGLSSGRERPLIPMRKMPERAPAEPGRRQVKGYGQKDASGREVRRSGSKWLAGMTPEEMSLVLVPSSKDEHFEMWADDLAGTGWRADRKFRKFLKDYYDQLDGHENALRIDFSPEGLEASRGLVRGMLESSPQMRWMFENFGAPLIGVFTRDAMNEYEGRPEVKERMELLRQQRGMDKTPFVSGLASREFGFVGLTPRALIDRESYDDRGEGYPLELNPNRRPGLREAHVDRSLHGTLIHEYGHWLHYRAIRDLETNGAAGQKTYYGSGKIDDPAYRAALDVAEEYANPDTDNEAIEIYSQFIDLTGRDAEEMFKAHPDKALIATSYGNVNKREAIAEAFVAIMHPNKDIPKTVLSPKLRRDVYALSGVDPDNLPWEATPDGRPSLSLSSGATEKPGRERRRNRISRALRQLVGANDETDEQEAQPEEPYEFEAPERPSGLVSFSAEPSERLRSALPVPSEDDMTAELENDIKQIPLDPIVEAMSSLNVSGFGTSVFASEQERKASASAKRMISLNISESAQIDPKEFIESFSEEEIESLGLDKDSAKRFFNSARNFKALKEVFDAIRALPPDATEDDKKKARRFAVDRVNGSIVPTEKHDKEIQKRFYFDSIIDELEKKSYEQLFGPEWEDITRVALNDENSVVSPFLIRYLGGDEIQRNLISTGNSVRNMYNKLTDEIRGVDGQGQRDPNSGKPLREGEELVVLFSPVGDVNPLTGEPAMALISRGMGITTNQVADDFKMLIRDGRIIPEGERNAEQRIAYDRLFREYGQKEGFLEQIASAGIFTIDKSNVDSQETKDLFKQFLIERLRFWTGFAGEYQARYEFKSGISFFDIDTPEGIREARAAIASDIIHTWAISANNSNAVALAIQHEARKMFGLDEAVGWYGRVRGPRSGVNIDSAVPVEQRAELGDLAFDDAPDLTERQRQVVRSVIQSIYDATQHYYKSKGITHVAIWRGMKGTPEMAVPRGELAERTVSMRPLSSWTTNSSMAQTFATALTSTKKLGIDSSEQEQSIYDQNLIMKAYVPVEQIFSNPLTGFGCLGEDEVVLLGRPTNTIMITPPANLLVDAPGPDATPEQIEIIEAVNSKATTRDRLTNDALRKLLNTDYKEFRKRFPSSGTRALSSGAQLASVTDAPIAEGELDVTESSGVSEFRIPGMAFAKRISQLLQDNLGITLTESQRSTIGDLMPNLMAKINKSRLQDIKPHSAFKDDGKKLIDSISISIASDEIPFVSADPIPQFAAQIPNKRDWRTIEIPRREQLTSVLKEAQKDVVSFDIATNEWVDRDGNVVARRVYRDGNSTLEYVNDSARERFPLLEAVAPKGYVISSDSIDYPSLRRETLPGIYGEAWKKYSEFMRTLPVLVGQQMGDESLFRRTNLADASNNFIEAYVGGIENPRYFNMGIEGPALQELHDLFGHLGTGRGFDRHGEWANDLAMISMVDHPDSPLSDVEKLAVKHIHYQIYSANRLGIGRLDEKDDSIGRWFPSSALNISGPDDAEGVSTRVYAGNFNTVVKKMEDISVVGGLSSGKTKIYEANRNDVEMAIAGDIVGFKERSSGIGNNREVGSTGNITLSSGKVIKYNLVEARMRAADMKVTFQRDPERVAAAKATLTKGFMGGFTVELDKMDDIKQGVAIARNKHGMKVDAVADFDAEGNPSDELLDTFLAWVDFHGPKTFSKPKPGAERTTIGGWVSDGTVYLDVVDVYPDTEENISRAADMGRAEDQIAVTNLTELWNRIERGEDLSPAFIDSGGTGGFTLDEDSVKRVSAALSELNSNKFNTGSMYLKRIGNSKKFTSGPITGARRVRNTNLETGEKSDYWVVSGADGMVKVFTHDQYLKVRDKKIDKLFDRMSTQSNILASMFEAKNIKPVASMKVDKARNTGRPVISKRHKNRGLSSAMAHLYEFANDKERIRILGKKNESRINELSSGKKIVNKKTAAHDKAFKEKFNQDVPEGDGDCFSQAITQVQRLEKDAKSKGHTNIKVVHGYPLGTGGEAEGLRFPHAWVEFTENGIEFVRDYSNGNRVEIPKAMYYLIGNIEENDTKKYSYEEAIRSMNESQHYGPW